jgi:poly(hydroxyalkanoate) depolymerase family esterase
MISMRLSETLARLKALRGSIEPVVAFDGPTRLSQLDKIQYNPGNLRGFYYVPQDLLAGAPLVVVLHGCTQTAAGYDHGSGWSRLADRHGFALLYPEQQRENNALCCFNWFSPGDTRRGMGEAASIRSMIDAIDDAHSIDRDRIFVTGLSAGGAMASVMLATYPEMFEAGAIIAGLPYGCASDVREAFDCMGGRSSADAAELAARVRRASAHNGPWPRVSVWQGSADHTVVPSNADALVRQWAALHGLAAQPSLVESIHGYPRSAWLDDEGKTVIERYDIIGMAHGTPLMPGTEEGQSGQAGAHMLDVDISSTDRIAAFFGIAPAQPASVRAAQRLELLEGPVPEEVALKEVQPEVNAGPWMKDAAWNRPGASVDEIINDAFRAAGLRP